MGVWSRWLRWSVGKTLQGNAKIHRFERGRQNKNKQRIKKKKMQTSTLHSIFFFLPDAESFGIDVED